MKILNIDLAGWALASLIAVTGVANAEPITSLPGSVTSRSAENFQLSLSVVSQTVTVENYATRVLGFLNGSLNPSIELNFSLPVSSATVQSAFSSVRSSLSTLVSGPILFTPATQTFGQRTLTDSIANSVETSSGDAILDVNTVELIGLGTFTFESGHCTGAVIPSFPDCGSGTESIMIAAGDTVLLTTTLLGFDFVRTITTTNTYLNSETWAIIATPVIANPVPEPSSGFLLGISMMLLCVFRRRRTPISAEHE